MDGRCESEQGVRAWRVRGATTEKHKGIIFGHSCGHDLATFGSSC